MVRSGASADTEARDQAPEEALPGTEIGGEISAKEYKELEDYFNEHNRPKPGYGRRIVTSGGESRAVYRKLGK